MDLVSEHLRRWSKTDFAWGPADCAIVLADYLADVVGHDCAAHLRGQYHDRMSCMRLTHFHRGLAAVVEGCVSRIPLERTFAPARGDIGVIRAGSSEVGALCLGERWAVKSTDGVLFLPRPEVLAAWAVPKG